MSEQNQVGSAAILGNFEITLPAPNGASMRITSYLYEGESQESLDQRMDTCRESLLRQQQVLEKPILEEKVKMLKDQEKHVEQAYADLLEKNKKRTLPSAEEQHLRNYPAQLKQIRQEIVKGLLKLEQIAAA